MDRRHRAALWYAKRGWRVFPVWPIRDGACACRQACSSPGKHPVEYMTHDWRKSATTDQRRINEWWGAMSDANVATSSWLRIDVDTKENGVAHWRALQDAYGRVDTVQCLTPSGGEHYYFRAIDGLGHSNRTGDLPTGIDVRGDGSGYTLLPPSNHIAGIYEWELSSRPDEMKVAQPPEWLVDLLPMDDDTLQAVTFDATLPRPDIGDWELSSLVESIILGDRSRIDMAVITALVFAGASDDEIRAVFVHYGVSGKYAEKNGSRDKYLALSIAKARAYAARQQAPEKAGRSPTTVTAVTQAWKRNRVVA